MKSPWEDWLEQGFKALQEVKAGLVKAYTTQYGGLGTTCNEDLARQRTEYRKSWHYERRRSYHGI